MVVVLFAGFPNAHNQRSHVVVLWHIAHETQNALMNVVQHCTRGVRRVGFVRLSIC